MADDIFYLKVNKVKTPFTYWSFLWGFMCVGFAFLINILRHGYNSSTLLSVIILTVFLVLVILYNWFFTGKYHILALEQKGNILEISYMVSNEVKYASVPVNELIMELGFSGRAGSILESITFYQYDIKKNHKILKQYNKNGWDASLIIQVYNHFCTYNTTLNSPPLTEKQIKRFIK